jgi:hypothetical protein
MNLWVEGVTQGSPGERLNTHSLMGRAARSPVVCHLGAKTRWGPASIASRVRAEFTRHRLRAEKAG